MATMESVVLKNVDIVLVVKGAQIMVNARLAARWATLAKCAKTGATHVWLIGVTSLVVVITVVEMAGRMKIALKARISKIDNY